MAATEPPESAWFSMVLAPARAPAELKREIFEDLPAPENVENRVAGAILVTTPLGPFTWLVIQWPLPPLPCP